LLHLQIVLDNALSAGDVDNALTENVFAEAVDCETFPEGEVATVAVTVVVVGKLGLSPAGLHSYACYSLQ
jgi:hypothetical protein